MANIDDNQYSINQGADRQMGEDEIGRLMEGMPTSDGETHSIRVHSADSANQKLVENLA